MGERRALNQMRSSNKEQMKVGRIPDSVYLDQNLGFARCINLGEKVSNWALCWLCVNADIAYLPGAPMSAYHRSRTMTNLVPSKVHYFYMLRR